jgi:hypothetical protein
MCMYRDAFEAERLGAALGEFCGGEDCGGWHLTDMDVWVRCGCGRGSDVHPECDFPSDDELADDPAYAEWCAARDKEDFEAMVADESAVRKLDAASDACEREVPEDSWEDGIPF